jgi:hypothetical protein
MTADPSGEHIAYTTSGAVNRLFLVESDGRSEPVLVTSSPTLLARPAFTHDGARLLFVDQGNLYAVPADGSSVPTVLLSGAIAFRLATQAPAALVLTGTSGNLGLFALWLDGSAPIDLLLGLPTGVAFSGDASVTSDGRWATFSVVEVSGGFSLYRVPMDGSLPAELISDPGAYYGSRLDGPDGTVHAFLQGQDLYRVELASGAAPALVHVFVGSARFPEFHFDRDGRDLLVFDAGDLRLYPESGGARLLNPAHPGAVEAVHLEPTGARALYVTVVDELVSEFTFDLWSVPIDGSAAAVRVNTDAAGPALRSRGQLFLTLATTPNGNSAVFTSKGRLEVGPLDGSVPSRVLVDDPAIFDLGLITWGFTPDSQTFVYPSFAYLNAGLFSVPLTGGRPPRQLDSPILGSGLRGSQWFQVLSQRRGVLFLADPMQEQAHELFLGVLDRPVRGVPR